MKPHDPADEPIPDPQRRAPGAAPARGRGATFNPGNRYRRDSREAYDDGWSQAVPDALADDAPPRQIATTVTIQRARTIIAHNDSRRRR